MAKVHCRLRSQGPKLKYYVELYDFAPYKKSDNPYCLTLEGLNRFVVCSGDEAPRTPKVRHMELDLKQAGSYSEAQLWLNWRHPGLPRRSDTIGFRLNIAGKCSAWLWLHYQWSEKV